MQIILQEQRLPSAETASPLLWGLPQRSPSHSSRAAPFSPTSAGVLSASLAVILVFHVRMRLSTSLPKKSGMCIKSQSVSTCHVHPVGITAVLPTLSSPLLVRHTFRQEVHARGNCRTPFHEGTPQNSHIKRNHVRRSAVSPQGTAASPCGLAACRALRRQENAVAVTHRVDERVCSTRHMQPRSTHRTTHDCRRNTTAVESTLYTKSDRCHAISCTRHDVPLLFLYADGKELHGGSRGRGQHSCCGRSLYRRDSSSSSRREADADVAAGSFSVPGSVRGTNRSREIHLQTVFCRPAIKRTLTRGEEARPNIIRPNRPTSVHVLPWTARNTVGKEHWCYRRRKEEMPRSADVRQEPATASRSVYLKSTLPAQKRTTSGESLARKTARGSAQITSRAVGGDAGSRTELLKLTAEQLQHTAEQVFLWSSSAASPTASPARGPVRAGKERSEGEETAMRCSDLPWERVLRLLHRWRETLVRPSELVSLEFTSSPLSRNTVCVRQRLFGRASGIAGKEARQVKGEAARKEGTATQQEAACAAEIATTYDSTRKTSRWKRGPTAEAAVETTAGVDTNIEGRHSDMTPGEKNTHLNRARMDKSLCVTVSRVAEKSEAPQRLSFYPPLFGRKEIMTFRLPWHELRSDITRPFFGTTVQCDRNETGEQTDTDSEIPKPRFWGRFFCLRNFSPIAKARAQLEQGVVSQRNSCEELQKNL